MRRFLALAVLALAGCATGSSVVVGKVRPPIDPKEVNVYLQPPAKYETIAMVEASSRDSMATGDQAKMNLVIERLKEQAAKHGANGILLNSSGEQSGAAVIPTYNTGGNYSMGMAVPIRHKTGSAIAIYVP